MYKTFPFIAVIPHTFESYPAFSGYGNAFGWPVSPQTGVLLWGAYTRLSDF
ncbi:hypothetical protein [Xylanibacter muris]|uniref:hypothetical protein n=1 Tax=Xylanibacter muris TaxID=2736290 RepID=UPI00155210DE|nr:hypothetical protein [Xylanibacter muris]